ncbi:hypothetical protein Tco_0802023 [Tanacetum coccineum]|uniref:Retrovirus-related Pol polyprotein from transposon TNT 1-94-like beta-barrel domain-containing protein n=1 Tax=Tanacetum coccineum TaxID=301880 RepID=A0ABQ4ZXM4_9ASTR
MEPKLYDGMFIQNTSVYVISDSEETLMLAEESHSKMLLKQKDPMMLEKKSILQPFRLSFWSKNSVNSPEPTLSRRPTKVEVPKELPKVSKNHTSSTSLRARRGFKHTKACFRDEIIPFVKALKDLSNTFDQYLIDELSEVQNVFHQMEQAVEQYHFESKTFEVEMNQFLNENERLLEQVINKDIVNIIMNSSMDNVSVNTYKQLYDLIKPARIRSKEQCDDLINQVNLKSMEISDLNASLQEKVLIITALKDDLRKLKGKALVDNVVTKHSFDPEMLKIDVEPITPKLLNKKTAHSAYIKHTQEEATVLRDLVEQVIQIVLWYLDSDCSKHMTEGRSQLTNFVNKFLGTVKFENDHVAKILGYGDYEIGNVTISRVYYVEGLGHNLFSVGQFAESSANHSVTPTNVSMYFFDNGKTPYVLLHDKPPDLSFLHVFGALCYPTNDSQNLGKLQPKADIATTNFHEMTPSIIISDSLPNPSPSTHVERPPYETPEVVDPIHKVVALVPAVSTSSPSSTNVDQDAPSPSNSQTPPETQPPIIPNDDEEENHDIEVAHMVDTPMVEKSKLDEDKEGKAVDPSHYRGMIGTLLYLTASRPDLQFSICYVARYQALFLPKSTYIDEKGSFVSKRNH